eukprot:3478938-Rhodomonas_salina.1
MSAVRQAASHASLKQPHSSKSSGGATSFVARRRSTCPEVHASSLLVCANNSSTRPRKVRASLGGNLQLEKSAFLTAGMQSVLFSGHSEAKLLGFRPRHSLSSSQSPAICPASEAKKSQ